MMKVAKLYIVDGAVGVPKEGYPHGHQPAQNQGAIHPRSLVSYFLTKIDTGLGTEKAALPGDDGDTGVLYLPSYVDQRCEV